MNKKITVTIPDYWGGNLPLAEVKPFTSELHHRVMNKKITVTTPDYWGRQLAALK